MHAVVEHLADPKEQNENIIPQKEKAVLLNLYTAIYLPFTVRK